MLTIMQQYLHVLSRENSPCVLWAVQTQKKKTILLYVAKSIRIHSDVNLISYKSEHSTNSLGLVHFTIMSIYMMHKTMLFDFCVYILCFKILFSLSARTSYFEKDNGKQETFKKTQTLGKCNQFIVDVF